MQQLASRGVIDHRPHWYRQLSVFALTPGALAAFAVPPAFRLVLGIKPEVQQSIVVRAGHHRHIAPKPAVAAARAAPGNKLLPSEGEAAVAAVARFHRNDNFVYKHGSIHRKRETTRSGRGPPPAN